MARKSGMCRRLLEEQEITSSWLGVGLGFGVQGLMENIKDLKFVAAKFVPLGLRSRTPELIDSLVQGPNPKGTKESPRE